MKTENTSAIPQVSRATSSLLFAAIFFPVSFSTPAYYTFHRASLRARTIPRFRSLQQRAGTSGVAASSQRLSLSTIPLTLPRSLIPFQLPLPPSMNGFHRRGLDRSILPFSLFPVFSPSSFYLLRSIRLPAHPCCAPRCSEGVGRLAARLTTCSTANPPTSSLLPRFSSAGFLARFAPLS